jgi:hypothetical protein
MNEHEYRVASPYRDNSPTSDPKIAGERFRQARRHRIDGEKIELQEREVGPWKTIERTGEHASSACEPTLASLNPSKAYAIYTDFRWDVR